MINVRLSKLGGFFRSFKIINYLRTNQLDFQIGCQLGESGILSAAGRSLCVLNRDAKYYDGSYDAFLLRSNITTENISFGKKGRAGQTEGFGLGARVEREKLRNFQGITPVCSINRAK